MPYIRLTAEPNRQPHFFQPVYQSFTSLWHYSSLIITMPTKDPNVGVAFALVAGAAMCTALGAAIVFSPTLVKYASRKTLAAALGLSAGVMSYLSFVKILDKSNNSFLDAGHSEDDAYMYSTLCFFAGVLLMIVSTCLRQYIVHSNIGRYCAVSKRSHFGRRVFAILFHIPHFVFIC
jgi:zinc transporter ZupT